jgi:hypothetical protein
MIKQHTTNTTEKLISSLKGPIKSKTFVEENKILGVSVESTAEIYNDCYAIWSFHPLTTDYIVFKKGTTTVVTSTFVNEDDEKIIKDVKPEINQWCKAAVKRTFDSAVAWGKQNS